jgi:glycosyltransferase involved in cell wall biosynthesis
VKKKISIVTPCFNEENNVETLYQEVRKIFAELGTFKYEHIFIDNDSKDRTPAILRKLAASDRNVKVILNARNFGHIRSPFYALLQADGDAVILMVADLQDPPHLIKEFVKKWQEGFKVVIGIKEQSEESPLMFMVRKMYYGLINRLSDTELVKNFTGFGLYDKKIVDVLRDMHDPYPYFRGLISEIGFEQCRIPYRQPSRKRGITKNNFYTLYDMAMLGITSHSKIPLRLATMLGFVTSFLSLVVAFVYLVYKLIFWNSFSLGIAPMVIGVFFFASVQLFFIGIIGEYMGTIYTQVLKRPLVVEKERINF